MADPTISAGQYGSGLSYTQVWSDEFDGSQGPLFTRWQPDTMQEGLHQTGNSPNITGGNKGRRWAAWYDKPEDCAVEVNGALEMRATLTEEPDIGRKTIVYGGQEYYPQNYKIRLAFLTTWARRYSNELGRHITDPNSPNRTWGPGTAFEIAVDFSQMKTGCMRFSAYLLPAYEHDSSAYTPDGTLGVENDWPEVDFFPGLENYAQAKVISETAAGNTPAGSVNLENFIPGIDLTTGVHVFTLVWQKDKFVWYVDGIEYQRDEDPRRIPQVPMYIVLSREANSGIRPQLQGEQDPETGEFIFDDFNPEFGYSDGSLEMPVDIGIWGRSVWEFQDTIDGDTAKVLYFRSWQIDNDTSVAGVGIGDDVSGISPTMLTTPPTQVTGGQQFEFRWEPNGRVISDYYLQVGTTRGGNELGQTRTTQTSATITFGYDYNGPVNARLWFRQNDASVWHWRDFGFSSGLQPYRIGTDGLIRPTTHPRSPISAPTVAGAGFNGDLDPPLPPTDPNDPDTPIRPNPQAPKRQNFTAPRGNAFGKQEWRTLVKGLDPDTPIIEQPGFVFSGGRRLQLPPNVLSTTVAQEQEAIQEPDTPATPPEPPVEPPEPPAPETSTPQLNGQGITLQASTHTFTWTDEQPAQGRTYALFINGAFIVSALTGNSYTVTNLPDDGSQITVEILATDDATKRSEITVTAWTRTPFTATARVETV